jgi:diguanylate cyclase (GGDEF)-like protein
MRVPLTLKICAGALFLAALQAVIAVSAFRALQSPAELGDLRHPTLLETVVTMQASLSALSSREAPLLLGEGEGSGPFLAYHQGQLQDGLEKLSREGAGAATGQLGLMLARYLSTLESLAAQAPGREAAAGEQAQLLRKQRMELETGLKAVQKGAKQGFSQRTLAAATRENSALLILLLSALGTVVGVGLSLVVARRVATALSRLSYATSAIAEGAFDAVPQVDTHDELGDLAAGVSVMAQKLKNYEQFCLDASPLTRLPGNIAIERALNDRLRVGEKFALCYVDLDNFKAYNDRYGYAKGSDIIKATGEILYESCRKHGRVEDFVGHIGGDDFVLITSPELVPAVCEVVIREFDRMIPSHYSAQDLQLGYIEATDRYGIQRRFPIMTLSIAVVSDDKRQISSPQEIAQVASEIKDFVKALPGSNYLVDRRRGQRSGPG